MSIAEVSAEELAELFYHYQHRSGPEFGRVLNSAPPSWQELPQQEKTRMVAAARSVLREIASSSREREESRRYFARPGEAEWGC
jgi:hypothetical protein